MLSRERTGQSMAGLRVLVVEDESIIAMLLENMLTAMDCKTVGPVAKLDKAVEMAEREALDVAILDVSLQGQEVYPVADALAARGIPFVFATGYGKAALHPPYSDRPALQKPFRLDDLVEVFAKIC